MGAGAPLQGLAALLIGVNRRRTPLNPGHAAADRIV
jgi:hypothetical protein